MRSVISAGGVLINENEHVLFCHPTNASWNRWGMPKGLVEIDESLEAGALREVREESGWNCRIVERIQTTAQYRTTRDGHAVMKTLILFLMEPLTQSGEPDNEHDAFRWVSTEHVRSYASERELPLIEEAIRLFLKRNGA
jgi:ADP-ribose pyrophosphatase YjhB (NUDIX family)